MLRPLVLLLCYPFLAAFAEPDWWKTSILYQIYPRSYADSNGDGDGDLNGIRQHVEHLKSIGVGIVWLSPIYNSPWQDMGYDISDYKSVHPKFGTLEDAKALIQKLHSEGIKIFMDLVPNHSSIEHPWFNASRHGQEPERDYYVWKDPKDRKGDDIFPPNNWLSAFDGDSAWEYDEIRKQFYLHHFGKYQADLNYSNPKLVEAMKDNMRFWLDLGVDGFRVDTPGFLAEHPDFPDEPWIENCTSSLKYNCLEHIYTTNQPRTYEVLHQFQEMLEKEYNSDKYMILEVFAPWDQWKGYYGPLMAPFNFLLVNDLWKDTNAKKLQSIVSDYMTNIPKGIWPNWVLGNHDNTRVATRMGVDAVDATNMLILLLPGTSINYQGEEIGMEDGHVRKYEILDCCNRDPQRTPMQWTSGTNAGFSTGNKTWLPVNSNYWNINVETQSHDSKSHLSTYKRLAKLRKSLVHSTDLETATIGDSVFIFKRQNEGKTYYVIVNLNNQDEYTVLSSSSLKNLPAKLIVYIPSDNAAYAAGDSLDTSSKITLRPRSGIVASKASTSGAIASWVLAWSFPVFFIFGFYY